MTGLRERAASLLMVFACLLVVVGCAGDTYAPVSDRTARAGGQTTDGYYEVVRGDTLFSIAFRHGLDHRTLGRWNNISEPYVIYPGQRLRLSAPPSGADRQTAEAPRSAPTTASTRTTPPQAQRPSASPRASAPPPRNTDNGWVWPASGPVLKTFSADADGKQGINIGGDDGAEVRAAAAGRVVYSGSGLVGYGNLIIIRHEGEYLTAYGYNRELLVSEGDTVRQGQPIARMGRNSGRAMLHFELRRDGRAVDPIPHLPRR